MRGADYLSRPGFIALVVPLVGLMLLVIAGAAAYATIGGDIPNSSPTSQFSFTGGDTIFSGTGFRGDLTPPIDPKLFDHVNTKPHGALGHGIFKITCKNSGAADYFANTDNTVPIYAIADGEVAAIRQTYISIRGNTGSILELRHQGNPSCSSYAHIDIDSKILNAVTGDPNNLSVGNYTTVIPANVSISVTKGQTIGRIAHPRANFTAHLHFQLDGASESQLQQSMQQLSAASKAEPANP